MGKKYRIGLFSSKHVYDLKWLEESRFLGPSKKLTKSVDLGEPTTFLNHVSLGCASTKALLRKYKNMFVSLISAGATQKCTWVGRSLTRKQPLGF